MKRYGVVRTLYGDILAKRRKINPPDFYFGMLKEVQTSIKRGEQSDLTCCWGEQNYRFLCSLGLKNVIRLSKEPYRSPRKSVHRTTKHQGLLQWGWNHFWHKWQTIRIGLGHFDAVMSVDWDCEQRETLSQEWWERQDGYGVSFRATLARQSNCAWGARWRSEGEFKSAGCTNEDARIVPHCCCFWICNKELVEHCIEWSEKVDVWMPEQTLAKELDLIHGNRWIGIEQYKKLGYEPDFITLQETQLMQPEKSIWYEDRTRRER